MRRRTYPIAILSVAAALACLVTTANGQGRRRGGGNEDAGMPVPTNLIVRHPDAYYGKVVTLSAGIVDVVSTTAFVVDQRKVTGPNQVAPIGAPLLVIAPYMANMPDGNHYLLMKGQIARLDAAALPSGYALSAESVRRFAGQPVLLATSVINSTYSELAVQPLPPPGPEEQRMMTAMKIIGPASAAIRTAAQQSQVEGIAENAAKLKPAFSQTETAWEDLGQSAPAEWAREARDLVAAMEKDAAAANWEAVKLSAGNLQQKCGTCHTAYRQRQEDGTFRIKAGAF